jgi:hypothetical protein
MHARAASIWRKGKDRICRQSYPEDPHYAAGAVGTRVQKMRIKQNSAETDLKQLRPATTLWRILIQLWMAATILLFVIIRILGSNTWRHLWNSH